jgi:hypothetical protein
MGMRKVGVILELSRPYLAVVTTESIDSTSWF